MHFGFYDKIRNMAGINIPLYYDTYLLTIVIPLYILRQAVNNSHEIICTL